MSHTSQTSNSAVPAVIASSAAGLTVLALCLLITGSFTDHIWLLAWGGVSGVLAITLGALVATRVMIHNAVDQCVAQLLSRVQAEVDDAVNATAVRVGHAIAESLREEARGDDSDDEGAVRLYS